MLTSTALALFVLSLALTPGNARAQAASIPPAPEKLCMKHFTYAVPARFEQAFER
jgi:hypothetical protein